MEAKSSQFYPAWLSTLSVGKNFHGSRLQEINIDSQENLNHSGKKIKARHPEGMKINSFMFQLAFGYESFSFSF